MYRAGGCGGPELYLPTRYKLPFSLTENPSKNNNRTAGSKVDPPYFVDVSPTDPVTINKAETFSLKCSAKGRPRPRIEWKKDGATIESETGLKIDSSIMDSLIDFFLSLQRENVPKGECGYAGRWNVYMHGNEYLRFSQL